MAVNPFLMDDDEFADMFGGLGESPKKETKTKETIIAEEQEKAKEQAAEILKTTKTQVKRKRSPAPIIIDEGDIDVSDEALIEAAKKADIPIAQVDDKPDEPKPATDTRKSNEDIAKEEFDKNLKALLSKNFGPVTEDMFKETTEKAKERIYKRITSGEEVQPINTEERKEEILQKREEFIQNKDLEGLEQFLLQTYIETAEMLRNAKLEQEVSAEIQKAKKTTPKKKNTAKKSPETEVKENDLHEGVYTKEEEENAEIELNKMGKSTVVNQPEAESSKGEEKDLVHVEQKLPFDDGLTVNEAANLLMKDYTSQDYENFKQKTLKALQEIVIDPDLTPGAVRFRMSQIDALRSTLVFVRVECKERLDSFMNKEYGVVTAYVASNSTGSNAEERKKAGYQAMENFHTMDGKRINLLKLFTAIKQRAEFVETIIKELENKQSMLMNYVGSLKIDASLTQ